jgi:hypothetical protein
MNLEQQIRRIEYLKPLVIGFLLGVGVMLLAGASANEPGPYRCCAAGTTEVAAFVVDTRDGHTWRLERTNFHDFGVPYKAASGQTGTAPVLR